jgi:hypothetical protein
MATINEEAIDKINDQLKALITYCDSKTAPLNNKSQPTVDAEMEKISIFITEKLKNIKDKKIVPPLKAKFETVQPIIDLLKPLVEFSLSPDPGVLLEAIQLIIGAITVPYQPAVDFTTVLTPKVLELDANIQAVATYQPTIEGATVPPLDIDVSLSISDITGGST